MSLSSSSMFIQEIRSVRHRHEIIKSNVLLTTVCCSFTYSNWLPTEFTSLTKQLTPSARFNPIYLIIHPSGRPETSTSSGGRDCLTVICKWNWNSTANTAAGKDLWYVRDRAKTLLTHTIRLQEHLYWWWVLGRHGIWTNVPFRRILFCHCCTCSLSNGFGHVGAIVSASQEICSRIGPSTVWSGLVTCHRTVLSTATGSRIHWARTIQESSEKQWYLLCGHPVNLLKYFFQAHASAFEGVSRSTGSQLTPSSAPLTSQLGPTDLSSTGLSSSAALPQSSHYAFAYPKWLLPMSIPVTMGHLPNLMPRCSMPNCPMCLHIN